jgi:polysaccharide deacetylase 2 family uncharacterized protein YibQ
MPALSTPAFANRARASDIAPATPTLKLDPMKVRLGAAGAVAVVALGAIQFLGDPHAASPRTVLPLDNSEGAFRTSLSDVVLDPEAASTATYQDANPEGHPPDDLAQASTDGLPPPENAAPLTRAPIVALTAPGPKGPLPIIGPGGTTPFSAYKRPFRGDASKPHVALIVGGLGFNATLTRAAIENLPADVTLSFVPYADRLQDWINEARAHGHEVMIELPMESFDSGESDTGPQTLTASGSAKDNVAKLDDLLSRGAGYFAVSNYQGSKFAQSGAATAPVVQSLKSRGLGFISNGIGARAALGAEARKAKLPFAAADRVLDAQREGDAIAGQLSALEALAQQGGDAIGAGFAYPVTVDQIRFWAGDLASRGIILAPASAVLEARGQRR